MKRFIVYILLASLSFAQGCKKDETEQDEIDLPIVNGYFARNEAGESMGIIGNSNPNVKLGTQNTYLDSDYYITFFPNPAINYASLFLKSPDPDETKKVWIVPAIYQPDYEPTHDETDELDIVNINDISIFHTETTGNTLMLDLNTFPSNYYRLYVEVGGYLFYDNIVIDKDYQSP